MRERLAALYCFITLSRPAIAAVLALIILASSVFYMQDFKLDASSDSLVLENDPDLRYYRSLSAHYGSDDFLVVTYQPDGDIFNTSTLERIRQLSDDLLKLAGVKSITSILDVPLIDSPRMSVSDLQEGVRTLETPGIDLEMARKEFNTSPLYRSLLTSPDGTTTALLVYLADDKQQKVLLDRRDVLWQQREESGLNQVEEQELEQLNHTIRANNVRLQAVSQKNIAEVRAVLEKYREHAGIHLGGVSMIASDMIDFIRMDIRIFGIGVALFLIVLLSVSFKQPRWVLVPLFICVVSAITMVGYLGMMDWRVTVVSSNFVSLLLILTLSLVVHLIVRHQELHVEDPSRTQLSMLRETVQSKFIPSFFTTLTTMVAFASLLYSGIRPVIDFGWMMVVGVALAFVLTFLLFPTLLAGLPAGKPIFREHDVTAVITRFFAALIDRFRNGTLLFFVLVIILSAVGINRLTVENRFIDYFKDTTEIYQGMLLIDKKLGGTTPLDVIIEPSQAFKDEQKAQKEQVTPSDGFLDPNFGFDPFGTGDPFASQFGQPSNSIVSSSYWFNMFQLGEVEKIHNYLESLPETGKVLSLATTMRMMTLLNNDEPLENLSLGVIYKRLPHEVKSQILDPYMSEDGNQIRFSIRVIDSDENLQRDALLKKIKKDLVEKFGLEAQQVHLSGMLVLYNNVLQSLFKSQIMTLSVVFLAITLMLLLLFRSLKIALIGIVPTIAAAGMILGLMGWLGIPLDIMTITIAAITIGIGVDDTIHYIHRFREELAVDGDYWAAVKRSHASVGRAIYYTSITITLGFSILMLSNFIPSIYFGVLTGIAMVVALVANLTLLPLLIVKFRAR